MSELYGSTKDDSVEKLRQLVLNKALELTVPAAHTQVGDTRRLAELFPHDDEEFSCRIYTYGEGEQEDGVIVQLSFNDNGIEEAHLGITDNDLVYEEVTSDGSRSAHSSVNQAMARQLLDRLQLKLRQL